MTQQQTDKNKKQQKKKRKMGMACVAKEKRIEIAHKGGLVRGKDKESLSQAGKKGGCIILKKYGLSHFAKLGHKDGKTGGVNSGAVRRAKKKGKEEVELKEELQSSQFPSMSLAP